MSSAIDLSQLPVPHVIEALDYETILTQQLADLRERDASLQGLTESDPAMKLLQVTAYRELLLRQRVNEAARAVMLAYAIAEDLDHLGALMDVPRLQVVPPDLQKGVAPVMESDADFRKRIQLAPQGFSVAGPEGAYIFHALGADGRVLDASVTSPSAGQVVVTILSREADGTATETLQQAVAARLAAVRLLTDYVIVQSAQIVHYHIQATLHTFPGPDAAVVVAEAKKRITQYTIDSHRLGRVPTLSALYAALHVAGVERVELVTPSADLSLSKVQAPFCDEIQILHGGIHG